MNRLNIPLVVFWTVLTNHHYARGFPLLLNHAQRYAVFTTRSASTGSPSTTTTTTAVLAKPRRLAENAPGIVYVNDQCINCAACSNFAPDTFSRSNMQAAHIVHRQPASQEQIQAARQALAACPVAAIRLETLAQHRHGAADKQAAQHAWTEQDQWLVEQMSGKASSQQAAKPLFPRPFLDNVSDVYWLGHHNRKSFGATPYLLRVPVGTDNNENEKDDDDVWIMIDTPKFSKSAVQAVTSLTGPAGPDYLFLTHVDDTADHDKWVQHFRPVSGGKSKGLRRIFHAGDLGKHNWLNDKTLEQVEILLQPVSQRNDSLTAYNLDGSVLPNDWMERKTSAELPVVILHTPGHSPGSITLYRRPANDSMGILFTGDTYAYTTRTNSMTSFPQYGNNHRQQANTIKRLVKLDWSLVAPGHGHPRDYRGKEQTRAEEMQSALGELLQRY